MSYCATQAKASKCRLTCRSAEHGIQAVEGSPRGGAVRVFEKSGEGAGGTAVQSGTGRQRDPLSSKRR